MSQRTMISNDNIYLERVLRKITPILIVSISIFALFGIRGVVTAARKDLLNQHDAGLDRIAERLTRELSLSISNGVTLAQDDALINLVFGESAQIGRTTGLAEDLIRTNPEYLAIYFVLPNGQVPLEVLNENGLPKPTIYARDERIRSPLAGSVLFSEIISSEEREAVIGSFRLQKAPGRDPITLLDVLVPVFSESSSRPIGVIQIVINAQDIISVVQLAQNNNLIPPLPNRHVILVDNQNRVIADRIDTRAEYRHYLDPSIEIDEEDAQIYEDTLLFGEQYPANIQTHWEGLTIYSVQGIEANNTRNMSWRLYAVDSATTYYQPTAFIILAISIVTILTWGISIWLVRRLLSPILLPVAEAEVLAQTLVEHGDMSVASSTIDGSINTSISQIAQRIGKLNSELDQQIGRRNRDLQIAGRIGREAAAQSDLDSLLKRAINMVCNELDFYHAQVFLVDEVAATAQLRFSRGEIGQKLLELSHQLEIGSHSIIGTVTAEKRMVIVNDTQNDEEGLHGFNPLLPNTRAEMALPLLIGERVIGALDIQSIRPNAFDLDDAPTYQLIADQLAVAIYNEQLREQAQQRIQQIDQLNRQLTRDSWNQVEANLGLEKNYGDETVSGTLTAPISIRGEVIGTLDVDLPDQQTYSDNDRMVLNSVAERVALAIENARLFQETQVSLAETSTLYDLSQKLNVANSLPDVLQAIIATVSPQATGGQVWMFDDTLPGEDPDWVSLMVDLPLSNRSEAYHFLGSRYRIAKYPFLEELNGTEVSIQELSAYRNPETPIGQLLELIEAKTLIFIPLNIRGEWKGFLSIQLDQAQTIGEQEHRIYNALISQAGVAIDNRLLLQQTENALFQQEKLYSASRIVNTAQSLPDLVYAAVATTSDPRLDFWLSLLVGDTDEQGWAEQARLVAKSNDGSVMTIDDEYHTLEIPEESPLRHREPIILTDPGDEIIDVPPQVAWMRGFGMRFMALFPLYSDNIPLAIFYIVCEDEYILSTEDFDIYRALTGQMSTQIQNRRLLERTEEALNETRRLYVATRAISGAQDSDAVYDAVAGHLAMPFIQRRAGKIPDKPVHISITLLMAQPEPSIKAPQLRYEYQWQSDPTQPLDVETGTIISHDEVPFGPLISENDDSILIYHQIQKDAPLDLPKFVEVLAQNGAISAAAAPLWSMQRWYGVLIVRSDQPNLLDDSYSRFMQAIADQVTITLENQRLQMETEFERERLFTILSTLPTGVLVLDAETFEPRQHNDRVEELLGQPLTYGQAFTASAYNMFRTGTHLHYPNDELPIYQAQRLQEQVQSDDIAIINGEIQTDVLMSAAPIIDQQGTMFALVAAFQDISTLRSMENTMQENLRETVLLYETQRTMAESETLDELFDNVIMQLAMQQPSDAYIVMQDPVTRELSLARSLVQPIQHVYSLRSVLQPKILTIGSIAQSKQADEHAQAIFESIKVQSAMIIPLRSRTRQEPMGWMITVDRKENAFTSDQERIMTTIADMASTAIDNQLLVASTQEALQETATLYDATATISRSRDLSELFAALETAMLSLHPDMYTGIILQGNKTIEMFRVGFDESIQNGLELDQLMKLPLRNPDGVFVDDLAKATIGEMEEQILSAKNIKAFAAINLLVKDMPAGRLLVGFRDAHRFTEGDKRFMSSVSNSANVVVDNQLLLDQVQTTLQETSILYQASKALLEADNPSDIVDVIVNYLIEPHVTQVFIGLLSTAKWDHPGASVEIAASWQQDDNIDLMGVSLSPEQFPAWRQLSTNSVLTFHDIQSEDSGLGDMEQISIESLGTRSLVVIPLRVPGRSIGFIWLGSDETYHYADRDLRVFQAFAEQTSLTLEAARLLEQTDQRARQLETSAVISQSVGQILDLDILLPNVVDLIKDQFEYDHVQIFLLDDESEWAELRASTGTAGEKLLSINHKLKRGSDSVIGKVTSVGEATIALDTADAAVVHQPNPYLPLTRSEMALPLIVKGNIVGALDVQSNQPNAFNEDDTNVLRTLAAQIAVAIDNASLYEEADQRAAEMGFLFEITTAAAIGETLDEALQIVSEQVMEAVQAQTVAIFMPQLYEDYMGNQMRLLEITALSSQSDIEESSIESITVEDSDNLLGIVGSTLNSQIIQNVEEDVRYHPLTPKARSAIAVPISTGSQLIGLIAMESERSNAFNNDTLTLLLTLAGSLSAIIQNAQLLDQLGETVEQLREVDRLKSQFLASMSHELRTPLNSIIGFSRVMLKGIDGPLTEMQEQDLTTIFNSGNHLLNLINDILDQAKIEANELTLKYAYFDVKPMIESVKSIAIGMMKETPLKLEVEVEPHMPQAYGDEFRSRQILLNLASNAIKFTTEGGVSIRAYSIESEKGQMIRIDVVDTGIGIAEQDRPALFAQFQQVDNSLTRTVGGTGLGLPISKSLAELQGGEITVESEINVGSTFSVTIPCYEGAEEEQNQRREDTRQQQSPAPAAATGIDPNKTSLISKEDIEKAKQLGKAQKESVAQKAKDPSTKPTKPQPRIDTSATQSIPVMAKQRLVLLIEDNKEMVDQFRRILQREGFDVQTADFPAYAEAMVGQLRPSVVLLDVNFANGVGWELLKNLKERDDSFDIPIIVTTIDTDSERAYQLGAHQYIQRPFLPDDILEAVLKAEKESQRERILIIDDEPEAIRLLTQLLTEHNDFKVFSAQSGDEGISLVARRRPDLIILDLRMPDKDGFAVLDELRGNPETARIPVLVVTGDIDLSSSEQEQLANVQILPKTEISQEEYAQFIENVRAYLDTTGGAK